MGVPHSPEHVSCKSTSRYLSCHGIIVFFGGFIYLSIDLSFYLITVFSIYLCRVYIYIYIYDWLVVCKMFIFHILGIIIPIDFHIFQRGRLTTNQMNMYGCCFFLLFKYVPWSPCQHALAMFPQLQEPLSPVSPTSSKHSEGTARGGSGRENMVEPSEIRDFNIKIWECSAADDWLVVWNIFSHILGIIIPID